MVFYDDTVMLKINKFEGESVVLQLLHDIPPKDYEEVMHDKPTSKKMLCLGSSRVLL